MTQPITSTICRTGYGNCILTAKSLLIEYDPEAYTTLNEAMNVPTIVPFQPSPATLGMETVAAYDPATDTQLLKLGYAVIGNKGHTQLVDPETLDSYTAPLQHESSDSGLYGLIPFIVVPVTSDLNLSQRSQYRLRKTMKIGGVLYAAYYCKVIDLSSVAVDLLLQVTSSGGTTTSAFTPNVNNLQPTAPTANTPNNGTFMTTTAAFIFPFTAQDVTNLIAACNLLYGTSTAAVVSEISICYGVDKPITGVYPTSGTQTLGAAPSSPPSEVVGLTAAFHICTYQATYINTTGFNMPADAGVAEPLFAVPVAN